MTDNFKVGIDIGSTTIKVVVLDAEEHIVYKPYPLSRTVSKSRTPCFRQFNNPGTFKMDVW